MKIATIVGARPQFIKCAPVSRCLRRAATEILIHTGQHYDHVMSDVFFRDLQIPQPDFQLGIGSGSHAHQTGQMLVRIEQILQDTQPDAVLVYGDTNSTLAGALAAAKLHIPVVHVEAGVRSYNRKMPEEVNRVLTDHIASLHLCPTPSAVENLAREGLRDRVYLVGDVMYDALCFNIEVADARSEILSREQLTSQGYVLATVHRAENTDCRTTLCGILAAFEQLAESGVTIVFPVHPRTRRLMSDQTRPLHPRIRMLDPQPYLDMLKLEKHARLILTDSGGVQKEAHWLNIPCVTLRNETEWPELLLSGRNFLGGNSTAQILRAVEQALVAAPQSVALPVADAAERIVSHILSLAVSALPSPLVTPQAYELALQ